MSSVNSGSRNTGNGPLKLAETGRGPQLDAMALSLDVPVVSDGAASDPQVVAAGPEELRLGRLHSSSRGLVHLEDPSGVRIP